MNCDGSATFSVCHFYAAAGAIDGYRHKFSSSGYYLSDDSGIPNLPLL